MIIRKSQAEIEGMARAGDIVADTLAMIGEELRPGVSMLELDRLAEDYIRERGGVPTSKGYRGYPAALCISPNAMIVHGIPTNYIAAAGDIVSIDLGVTLDGLIARPWSRRPASRSSAAWWATASAVPITRIRRSRTSERPAGVLSCFRA